MRCFADTFFTAMPPRQGRHRAPCTTCGPVLHAGVQRAAAAGVSLLMRPRRREGRQRAPAQRPPQPRAAELSVRLHGRRGRGQRQARARGAHRALAPPGLARRAHRQRHRCAARAGGPHAFDMWGHPMSGRLQRGHQGPLSLHSNDFRSCGAAALHKRIAMSPMRNVRTARPAARSACADRRARRRAPDRARPHARRAGAASAAFHKSSRAALAALVLIPGMLVQPARRFMRAAAWRSRRSSSSWARTRRPAARATTRTTTRRSAWPGPPRPSCTPRTRRRAAGIRVTV